MLLISGAYEFVKLKKKQSFKNKEVQYSRVLISSRSGKSHKNLMEKLNKYIDIDKKKLLEQRGEK